MRFRVPHLLLLALALLFGSAGQSLAKGDIGEGTYSALAKVQILIEGERYEEASTRLESIDVAMASSYERALVLQTRGYLHARKGQHQEAIAALKACLALDALPKPVAQDVRYLLIQMQAVTASWEDAAAGMDAWLASEKRPPAQAQALAGSVYAQAERLEEAAKWLRGAIDESKEPKELWFRQLMAVYFKAKRYEVAATLLGDMVRRFPMRKDYWLKLADTYRALGDNAKAAAVLELAYQRGLPFGEGDLLKLANGLSRAGLPHEAGCLLAKALSTGAATGSAENWQLLSNTWLRAREIPQALNALEKVLELGPSADLQLRRAQLAAEIEDWSQAYEAANIALSTGGLAKPGAAHLVRGIAQYYLGRQADALEAFKRARSFETSRSQAEEWVGFLTDSLVAFGDRTKRDEHRVD